MIVFHLIWNFVSMPLGEVLYEPGKQLQNAYFPTTSIVSLHYITENGSSAEISGVGNEGMIGVPLFMGGHITPSRATVCIGGHGYQLKARLLMEEFHRAGGRRAGVTQKLMLRYTQALMTQISQTTVCNRHHSIKQQLCRWLLLSLDRLPTNELTITQELIAYLLGVRRESITETARNLQRESVISYRRGHITVLNRAGLDSQACECYQVVKKEFHRLLNDTGNNKAMPPLIVEPYPYPVPQTKFYSEDAIHLREVAIILREQEMCAAKGTQTAPDDLMAMLRESNARLVIAAIEAQKLTEQVKIVAAQLEISKLAAEKANLAKSDFLSGMSHELRTPLNAILGFSQLLEGGSPTPTDVQRVRLHQITKAGWYLLELVNEILDLSVIESGKISVTREAISLIDAMSECQAMIEPLAQQHGIHINFQPFEPHWYVNADHIRMHQVLINLLSNAVKYNRAHGTVEVTCAMSSQQNIRISIKDSGEGLSPENLAQLFQPFNRLGQETGSREGTGIGLVVSKQLVELMGGTIGVESTVGVGSDFWIELIRDDMPQLAADDIMPVAHALQAPENGAPRTLLYVEDNPANLMLVEQIVEDYPHLHLLSATKGNHGITLARTHLPDIILMDINLPDINGIDALKILHGDPATKHIPVIALSANAMPRHIEKALKAGFFRYLTKPIKVDEFMAALDVSLVHGKTDALKNAARGLG